MPGEPKLFQPLEDAIRKVFISSVFNHEVNDLKRDLLSLTARMGGMGITKPTEECIVANANSMYVSRPLVRLVMQQEFELCPQELMDQIKRLRANVDRENERRCDTKLRGIMGSRLVAAGLKLALKACSEKGAELGHSEAQLRACHRSSQGRVYGRRLHKVWLAFAQTC